MEADYGLSHSFVFTVLLLCELIAHTLDSRVSNPFAKISLNLINLSLITVRLSNCSV